MPDFHSPRLLSFLAARRRGTSAPTTTAPPQEKQQPAKRPKATRQSILQEVLKERAR